MKWRFLGPRDFEWMLDVSKEHHKESDWSEVEYSEDKVKGYITTALKDPNYFHSVVQVLFQYRHLIMLYLGHPYIL